MIWTPTQVTVPLGAPDSTPDWNQAIEDAKAGSDHVVRLQGGTYHFTTPPNPVEKGVQVLGQGFYPNGTVLERDYQGGSLITDPALDFIRVYDLNSTIRNLSIFAGPGTTLGRLLMLKSSDARPAGWNIFEDMYVSGEGTALLPVLLDGTQKVTEPKGARDITLRNFSVFNGTWYNLEAINPINLQWIGGGSWQGFGTQQHVILTGSESAANMILAAFNGQPQFWQGATMTW